MGLPGAGKSTVKKERFRRDDLNVEADKLKQFHPRYSRDMGAETDEEVHRWSVRRSVDEFDDAVAARRRNLVFDSSGSNARWLGRRVQAARDAGYTTELLWVDVPEEIALFRNRNRATRQWCPEKVIQDKSPVMQDSFEELRTQVDSFERLKNWNPNGAELREAQLDLHLYPAPRLLAPSLRPGDSRYGDAPTGARSPSPTIGSRRTLRIGPWKRNDEVMRRKTRRLEWMDATYVGNRDKFVLDEVLKGREVLLEPNAYPYMMPPGCEHWTIWALKAMEDDELYRYVERWIDERQPHNVASWNYDDNRGKRTIDLWHVHIYFQGHGGRDPLPKVGPAPAQQKKQQTPSCQRSPCSV